MTSPRHAMIIAMMSIVPFTFIPARAGMMTIKYRALLNIMLQLFDLVMVSVVTPVCVKLHAELCFPNERSTAARFESPRSTKSHRPTTKDPAHATVRSIIVDPARVPIPIATSSVASGPQPDIIIITASGSAPRTGRTKPPIMPGLMTCNSSSLPSLIYSAPLSRMKPYTIERNRGPSTPSLAPSGKLSVIPIYPESLKLRQVFLFFHESNSGSPFPQKKDILAGIFCVERDSQARPAICYFRYSTSQAFLLSCD
mmetsp:Transcript_25760/g.31237  ORF Transcript_25760/g.31237 Transcript_25760/m.31237 type:complete len:255 (+) Transcript_25760:2000-2764(+)